MAIDKFPFTRLSPVGQYKPYLYVRISNPKSSISMTIPALIDTGAEDCALPGWYAVKLGHNLRKGHNCRSVHGIGGATEAYAHTCTLEVLDMKGGLKSPVIDYENVVISKSSLFDFVENWNMTFAILGVNGFLRDYILTIDYPNHLFSLTKP